MATAVDMMGDVESVDSDFLKPLQEMSLDGLVFRYGGGECLENFVQGEDVDNVMRRMFNEARTLFGDHADISVGASLRPYMNDFLVFENRWYLPSRNIRMFNRNFAEVGERLRCQLMRAINDLDQKSRYYQRTVAVVENLWEIFRGGYTNFLQIVGENGENLVMKDLDNTVDDIRGQLELDF